MPALQQLLDSSNEQLAAIDAERSALTDHVSELESALAESRDRLAQLDTEEARTRKVMGEVGTLVGDLRRDMNGDAPAIDPAADPAAQLAEGGDKPVDAAPATADAPEPAATVDTPVEDDTARPAPVAGAGSPYAG